MTAHELAKQLLKCKDVEVQASIDISTNDNDIDRRIFTDSCIGINEYNPNDGIVIILFSAVPKDSYGRKI